MSEFAATPRVMVTGMGAVSCLGDAAALWDNLRAGQSGIRRIETISTDHMPVKIAGEVRDFDPRAYLDHKEARRMGRTSQFAVVAAKRALADAGYPADNPFADDERAAVVIGTTMGPHDVGLYETLRYKTNGHKRPNPMNFLNCLPNMPAHYVSRFVGAFGVLSTPSSACASGGQAIGDGVALIRSGRAAVVLAGGAEAILQDYVMAGFESMNALATAYNDCPAEASRPFDAARSGFVMSEGAAVLVLESLAHAQARGARIYAEIVGHAASSDGYHVAMLDPQGAGAVRAMRWALQDAALSATQIDYINAHGTSTPANDAMETAAIKAVFGAHAYQVPISSTKSMIGHALGAAGALEAIATVYSVYQRTAHPTINYHTPDPACDLDYVPNAARALPSLRYAMSNSFGLGGQNAVLIFAAVDHA
jgi:3-oxoacyl-[acyl-carrier-protein] synthase II